jgi:zona occludens toxin (predicted ATPase)
MIIGFVGNPGSGKTYDAVRKILDNLRLGRIVYTNIDGLEIPECQESIKALCGISDYALQRQLKIFEPGQLEDFWNHVEPGSLIVIDEIQKLFSNRDWQTDKNRQFGFWASTHRHQGFDLILISQRPERIDAAVRALFEWCYFYRKMNFFGSLVQQKYLCYAYPGEDTSGPPLKKTVKEYNPRVFRCYKSYAGKDVKELGIMQHVNVLKHPVFFILPLVLCFTLYMVFFRSSFKDGDLFGTKAQLASIDTKSKTPPPAPKSSPVSIDKPPPATPAPAPTVSPEVASSWQSLSVIRSWSGDLVTELVVFDGALVPVDRFPYEVRRSGRAIYALIPVSDQSKIKGREQSEPLENPNLEPEPMDNLLTSSS